jgi:predicted nucleic acid-binding protein
LIFVDTSFWAALTNRRDPHHEQARALLAAYASERLVTTGEVRGETWTFLRRRAGHDTAVRFLDSVSASPRTQIIRVSEPAERAAEQWLRGQDDREFSWVDATSFATMRELRTSEAFAFDGDFSAAGFIELRA